MSEKKLDNQFVRETYNKFLSSYDKSYSYHRWFREPISRYHYKQSRRSFLYALKKSHYEKALEIGGGDGQWTKILLDYVEFIDFYDISEEMIKQAKARLVDKKNVNFILGDFLENKLADQSYDFVLSFRSFEYFDDQEKFLSEVYRLLKKGGKMIMVTKSPHYDWTKYYQSKKLHSGILPINDLIALFRKHGFEIELVKPAILGKKLSWLGARFIFDIFHRKNFWFKFNLLPLFLLRYIAESFIIKVVRK